MHRTGKLASLAALALFAVLIYSAWQAYSTLQSKAAGQKDALAAFGQWQSNYTALQPVQKRWDSTFTGAAAITDRRAIYRLLDIEGAGLSADMDKMNVDKIEKVTAAGIEIGLVKACLTSAGEAGLSVNGDSYAQLLSGIDRIAKRRDIQVESISVSSDKGMPKAVLGGFCMMVRG